MSHYSRDLTVHQREELLGFLAGPLPSASRNLIRRGLVRSAGYGEGYEITAFGREVLGPRRHLVARFDVTDLDQDEIDYLVGEITAQADRSEGHPSVPEPIITQEGGTT